MCRREGANTDLSTRFAAVRLRPAPRGYNLTEPHAEEWLLIEWPEDDTEPIKYWLSALVADISLEHLVNAVKLRWELSAIITNSSRNSGSATMKAAAGAAFIIMRASASPLKGSSSPSGRRFPFSAKQSPKPLGQPGQERRRLVNRARDPHPGPAGKLDLDGTISRPRWRKRRCLRFRGHHRWYEADLLFGSALLLGPDRPSPLKQLRAREAVALCLRRHLSWRLQALQHDLEFLIFGLASPPTRLRHFQPLDLSTARLTVHKDSSQNRASPGKAASLECLPSAPPNSRITKRASETVLTPIRPRVVQVLPVDWDV